MKISELTCEDRTGLCTVREFLTEMLSAQCMGAAMLVPLPAEGVSVLIEITVKDIRTLPPPGEV